LDRRSSNSLLLCTQNGGYLDCISRHFRGKVSRADGASPLISTTVGVDAAVTVVRT
jgi:hypothetical protein